MTHHDITIEEDRIVFPAKVDRYGIYVSSEIENLVEAFCKKHGLKIEYWNGNADDREGWVKLEKDLTMEEAEALEEDWYENINDSSKN